MKIADNIINKVGIILWSLVEVADWFIDAGVPLDVQLKYIPQNTRPPFFLSWDYVNSDPESRKIRGYSDGVGFDSLSPAQVVFYGNMQERYARYLKAKREGKLDKFYVEEYKTKQYYEGDN